jgi:hypothetical protein
MAASTPKSSLRRRERGAQKWIPVCDENTLNFELELFRSVPI